MPVIPKGVRLKLFPEHNLELWEIPEESGNGQSLRRILVVIREIIIPCKFYLCYMAKSPPAITCLETMACSFFIPSKCVLMQIIFCSCVIRTTLLREKWHITSLNCQGVIANEPAERRREAGEAAAL